MVFQTPSDAEKLLCRSKKEPAQKLCQVVEIRLLLYLTRDLGAHHCIYGRLLTLCSCGKMITLCKLQMDTSKSLYTKSTKVCATPFQNLEDANRNVSHGSCRKAITINTFGTDVSLAETRLQWTETIVWIPLCWIRLSTSMRYLRMSSRACTCCASATTMPSPLSTTEAIAETSQIFAVILSRW
jgi:hypothetical protein